MHAPNLETTLRSHVEELCKTERNLIYCPEGLDRAENYLADFFESLGCRVTRQMYLIERAVCVNLDAVFPGFVGLEEPHYIIGAHYDSAPGTPGADDNSSAVAILLELARMFADSPCAKRLRFVAYTNEEPPHFYTQNMGSVVHARACVDRGDRVLGMICLESLGIFTNEPGTQTVPSEFESLPSIVKWAMLPRGVRADVGNFLAVIANPESGALMRKFTKGLKRDKQLPVLATDRFDIRLSDHLAYWEEGIPAIMLTDTALYRNKKYHQAGDTPEKLNYPIMTLLTHRIAAAVEGLVGKSF